VELAKEMKGEALRFENWERAMHDVDIIISSTSAPHFVVTPELVGPTMRRRHGRPLFIIDIAVPRDVDPLVNDIEDVYLYNVDQMKGIADEGRRDRERALVQCEEIIEEQLRKFGYHEDSPPLPVVVTKLPAPPLNLETPSLEP
jgi:glutamyl-tRNA reductase